MTTFDFQDGKGPVPARQHPNGGGWVADTATVSATAYIGPDAWIYGNARVYDNAMVYGGAKVLGDANVFGKARVYDDAWVYGKARVYGDAWVYGKTRVSGDALSDPICESKPKSNLSIRVVQTLEVTTDKEFDTVRINGIEYVKKS